MNQITISPLSQITHASLQTWPALRAFEMNKLNGGKQQKQHDIIVPESNPTAEHCGKMTMDNGEPERIAAGP